MKEEGGEFLLKSSLAGGGGETMLHACIEAFAIGMGRSCFQVRRICRSQSGLSVILKTITVCPPGEIPSLSGFTSFGCQIECSIISTDPADSPHGEHFHVASGGSGIHEPVWGVGISLSSRSSETGGAWRDASDLCCQRALG